MICATLGIHLIHARAYQPQGKGKIERFFRTCRAQLLPSLGEQDTRSLDALNARLAAWIEGEYHLSPHRGLDGAIPLDHWARTAANIRLVGPATDLDTLFRYRLKRRVSKDRTVSINGTLYEVDAASSARTSSCCRISPRPARAPCRSCTPAAPPAKRPCSTPTPTPASSAPA